jgi:hypothetical protein
LLHIAGDRKYKIPVFDPLTIQEFHLEDSNIESSLLDARVSGLRDIALQRVR